MPLLEAPRVELGSAPGTPSAVASPSASDISTASSPEPRAVQPTPLFRVLARPPPEPEQPRGQEELERRLPGYRRIVIPREMTLIELLKECSGVSEDEEVLLMREARLRVVAERVGLRRLHVFAPRLRALTLDGSALASLRDLGIGLTHLKMLSVNRCGLTSFDGIWSFGNLRELFAAGNQLRELQSVAGHHKLHTLDLSHNPISDLERLWTLSICRSLRNLSLAGTPVAADASCRSRIAALLPMLVYLDNRPLHTDIDYGESEEAQKLSSSDSECEDDANITALSSAVEAPQLDLSVAGPSTSDFESSYSSQDIIMKNVSSVQRPATADGVGLRPPHPALRSRPLSAQPPQLLANTSKLVILNGLMDEESRCSGSELTSHGAVCGNLTRALRRPFTANRHTNNVLGECNRSAAEEIPRAPRLEDWTKFKMETGIDIDIDFTIRPKGADPTEAIERLERIERETMDRLSQNDSTSIVTGYRNGRVCESDSSERFPRSCDELEGTEDLATVDPRADVDALLDEMYAAHTIERNETCPTKR